MSYDFKIDAIKAYEDWIMHNRLKGLISGEFEPSKDEPIKKIGKALLINGDCLDYLPFITTDALVTDPPYGIGEASSNFASREKLAKPTLYERKEWDNKPLSQEVIDDLLNIGKWQVIFGGQYYYMPPATCWLVWDKENGETDFADCEMAWTNLKTASRLVRWQWSGFLRKKERVKRVHPTQKPVGVMKWCIDKLPDDCELIFDPFMGSGTTGVAAVEMGKRFIGIERDESYFKYACKRIEEAQMQQDLFLHNA